MSDPNPPLPPGPPTSSAPDAEHGRPQVRGRWSVRLERVPATVRAKIFAGVILVAMLAFVVVVGRNNPSDHPDLPECPTISMLGVYCPGCGSTRASHHLINGDLGAAFRYNPALVIIGLPFAGLLLVEVVSVLLGGTRLRVVPSPRIGMLIFALLLGYMVVRNIPIKSLDVIRPPASLSDAQSDVPSG